MLKLSVNCPFCEKEVTHELFNVFGFIYEAPKGTYSYHELSAEPVQEQKKV